jgi:protein-disulfide isomerase
MRYLKDNSWQIVTIVLGLLLVVSLFTNGFNSLDLNLASGSKEEIANNVINFVNDELLQGQAVALLNELSEENGLYKLDLDIAGQQVDAYVTKDGSLFFPQGIELEEFNVQPAAEPSMGGHEGGEVVRANVDVKDSPSKGDDTAKVVIVEYSDFQCPFCKKFYDQTLSQIQSTYVDTGKVKFVYKHYPLSFHSEAEPASLASECANEQGKFWEYHDLIFDNQGQLSSSIYSTWAEQLGLDVDQFNECFESKKYLDKVQKEFSEGQSKGITGTPGFLINGRLVSGAQPFSSFEQIIEEELGNRETTTTGSTAANIPSAGGCGIPSGGSAPAAPTVVAPSGPIQVNEDGDPFLGDENAPVVVVSFEDYQCPFCKRAFDDTFPQLKSEYIDTGKVKFVYRDYPLSFHPDAQKSAEAAECAGDQDKYWEMHDLIFNNQQSLSVDNLKGYASQLGLDSTTFDGCLDSREKTSEVQNDFSEGQSYGVTGTPTYFINGNKLVGAQHYSAFKTLIDQELNS